LTGLEWFMSGGGLEVFVPFPPVRGPRKKGHPGKAVDLGLERYSRRRSRLGRGPKGGEEKGGTWIEGIRNPGEVSGLLEGEQRSQGGKISRQKVPPKRKTRQRKVLKTD